MLTQRQLKKALDYAASAEWHYRSGHSAKDLRDCLLALTKLLHPRANLDKLRAEVMKRRGVIKRNLYAKNYGGTMTMKEIRDSGHNIVP